MEILSARHRSWPGLSLLNIFALAFGAPGWSRSSQLPTGQTIWDCTVAPTKCHMAYVKPGGFAPAVWRTLSSRRTSTLSLS